MTTTQTAAEMATGTTITITRATGVGVLTKAADGRWDIQSRGQQMPRNYYYDNAQVDKMLATLPAAGATIEIR